MASGSPIFFWTAKVINKPHIIYIIIENITKSPHTEHTEIWFCYPSSVFALVLKEIRIIRIIIPEILFEHF